MSDTNSEKKYLNEGGLSHFLTKLRDIFSPVGHKHSVKELTDYTIDDALSATSTNPVQNKVLDAEFEAMSEAMLAYGEALAQKAPLTHDHNDLYDPIDSASTALGEAKEYTNEMVAGLASTSAVNSKITEHNESTSAHADIRGSISTLNEEVAKKATSDALNGHLNADNPHGITKETVGLGNVENLGSSAILDKLTDAIIVDKLGYTPVKEADMNAEIAEQIGTVNEAIADITSGTTPAAKAEHATEADHATTADTAEKLGATTVGGAGHPIYLANGVATEVGAVDIAHGGTGGKTVAEAQTNLEVYSKSAMDTALSGKATPAQITQAVSDHNESSSSHSDIREALAGKVPSTRTINGKALSANVTLTPSDIGAAEDGHDHEGVYMLESEATTQIGAVSDKIDEAIEDIKNGEIVAANATTAATAGSATTADKATKDASGNIITTHYETKSDATNKLTEAKTYTNEKVAGLASVSSVNSSIDTHNKSDAAHSDIRTSISTQIATHNAGAEAHSDIRNSISELSDKLTKFLDVDAETTDQLSEVLGLINANKGTLESLTTSKINVSAIVDNLTTNDKTKVLSAAQGVILKGLIDALDAELASHDHAIADVTGLQSALDGKSSSTHIHDVTVTGTNSESTVTGSVTVPTLTATQKYLTAVADAPSATPKTDKVLGADTTFAVGGGTAITTKLSATATGVGVGVNGTANAITGFGTHGTAKAITAMNTTTIKNPTATDVAIPNVTGNASVTASKIEANADVVATKISSYGSKTNGTAANWNAEVSNGVLSFTWTPNTPTAVTMPTGKDVTASKVTASDVSASKVTLGTALNASHVTTSDVSVATTAKTTADAIVTLGTPQTASVMTGVKVTSQPTVTIKSGTNGDVSVATGVNSISVTASGDEVTAMTGVTMGAPVITLSEDSATSTGAVPVVSTTSAGNKTVDLVNGKAAAQTWTQKTGSTGSPA